MRLPLLILAVSGFLAAQDQFVRRPRFQMPTGTASVEGSVLDAITREPVKKATVALNGMANLTAVTDAAGHFAFRQLPEGHYMVHASNPNYPQGRPGVGTTAWPVVTLAADEHKKDMTIALAPGASIRGKILDEEGNPMPRCSVSPMRYLDLDSGRTLNAAAYVQSNEKGEYRIVNIQPGKYFVMARCWQTIRLPHPFIRRSALADAPALMYPVQFYPGVPEPTGATRVDAAAGSNLMGIDFRLTPAAGITVRGRLVPPPNDTNVRVALEPKDPIRRGWQSNGVLGFNISNGEFKIANVMPGSYVLYASGMSDGRRLFSRLPLEIGTVQPERIDLPISVAPDISGTLSIESEGNDPKPMLSALKVTLTSVDGSMELGQAPQGDVKADGTFTLTSVPPGRWRMFVNGAPGYIKSVTQGDQEFPSNKIDIVSTAPLRVVVSTKQATVDATLAGTPPEGSQVFGFLWSAAEDTGFMQNFAFDPQGRSSLSTPPGRYFACAVTVAQPWGLMQERSLRKALESSCKAVDLVAGDRASVQLPLISTQELQRLSEKVDEQ